MVIMVTIIMENTRLVIMVTIIMVTIVKEHTCMAPLESHLLN